MSDPELTKSAAPVTGHVVAVLLVAVATGAAVLLDQTVNVANLSLVFVLPVVLAAALYGWGAALTAVVTGLLCFNFFLIEPRYTLRVEDASNLWGLALLMVTAAIVSAVAAQSRARAVEADRHAAQAMALQGLARALNASAGRQVMLDEAAATLAQLWGAAALVLTEGRDGLEVSAQSAGAQVAAADLEAARWAAASRLATRAGVYPVEGAAYDFWPFATASRGAVVLGVALTRPDEARPADPERLIDIVAGQLTAALEREDFAARALKAGIAQEGERLKADLLAAVSHDLRTPLASILVSLQSLRRFGDAHTAQARDELLGVAEAETARLAAMVSNLLDMSRLDAGAVPVRAEALSIAALTAAALERVGAALNGREVRREGDDGLRLRADPALAEAALGNLIENAAKYSTAAILVRSYNEGGMGIIEVLDSGAGFSGPVEPLFERFARGVEGDGRPPGTGLGLAIARGFAEAQGGRVEAGARPDGQGAAVRLILPLEPAGE